MSPSVGEVKVSGRTFGPYKIAQGKVWRKCLRCREGFWSKWVRIPRNSNRKCDLCNKRIDVAL